MKKRLLLITLAFCISFLIMGALSLFSIERLNKYIAFSNLMDHSGFVLEKIYDAEKNIRDIDRTERGYMITKDTMYLRYLNNSIDSIYFHINQLKLLTSDNPELQKNILALNATVATRVNAVRNNIAYVDTCKSTVLSKYYYDSRLLMLDCSRLLKTIHQSESQTKADRYKDEQFYEQLTTRSIKWLLLIFCVITLFLFVLLVKELGVRLRYQEELQAKVIDLKRSHDELKEIAFVASHDLQEPLRKIQIFSNMLLYQKADGMDTDSKDKLERINVSAVRMQSLITDLSNLTSLTAIDEAKKETDIARIVQYIILDNDERIKDKSAIVDVSELPILRGYENQMKILFSALLDNALKFGKPDERSQIMISSAVVSGKELFAVNANLKHKKFYKISVSDNGIGFDKQFLSKMFQIFQRLHQSESKYDGKGIGLAICQRIMANHEGYILAEGSPNKGATFSLYFPYEG